MATRNTNIVVPKLEKGVIGGDIDRWGYKWNENIDKLSEFHTKVIADSEMQNQELARLENEKLNIEDIPSKVEPVVQEFLETTIKPEIDDYIDTVSKPDITKHVETKKQEINTYVNTTSKPALDSYEKEKEKELNTYTTTKKGELDSHTIAKKGELDAYEKTKETQLNNYTGTKQTQLDSYTNTKKGELDTHTTAKEGQLDTYTTGKERELDTHTAEKKSELDVYEKTKEGELNTFTGTKKTEITNHTNTKKGELDTYTTQKKGEITTHTDSEIERINADSELAKKQNITDSGLQTDNKEIVGAINESLWRVKGIEVESVSDETDLLEFAYNAKAGFYIHNGERRFTSMPPTFGNEWKFECSIIEMKNKYRSIIIKNYNYNRSFINTNTSEYAKGWIGWNEIINSSTPIFKGTMGVVAIQYIQDEGTKTQGQGYIDKSTGQVYLCLETNTDTTITNKFMSITNVELGKKIKQNTDDKVNKTDIVDNLTTADKSKVLSANMGKYLEDNKQNKTDSRLQTKDKDIVNSINEINLLKGGIIKGVLKIDNSSNNNLYLLRNGVNKGEFDTISDGIMLYNSLSKKAVKLFDNGSMELQANNLATNAREVIDAINEEYKLIKGNSGISSIIYIQDAGQKTAGNGYVDKTTGQLYLCKVTTTDTSVTDKFLLATNIENRDRISVIEEKLGIYYPVGKISTISVSRDENSSSPTLSFSSL